MYSLGEVNFIQGMRDFGNPKNSVGLKPNAELRKDALNTQKLIIKENSKNKFPIYLCASPM